MQIIGAGFGRTGTMSLKVGLEMLGFGPCYHMIEVLKHPSHIQMWLDASEGQAVDWQKNLAEYQSGLDYPVSVYYQELLEAFPEAKVILTVRDPERWYQSTYATIFQGAAMPKWLMALVPPFRNFTHMLHQTIWDGLFQGRFEEKEYAIQVFEERIAEVKNLIPAERLLIFEVKEGWGPLCEFLDVPVPDKLFPHVNDRRSTKLMFGAARVVATSLIISVIAGIVWLMRGLL